MVPRYIRFLYDREMKKPMQEWNIFFALLLFIMALVVATAFMIWEAPGKIKRVIKKHIEEYEEWKRQ
jgi:hypothetical protein